MVLFYCEKNLETALTKNASTITLTPMKISAPVTHVFSVTQNRSHKFSTAGCILKAKVKVIVIVTAFKSFERKRHTIVLEKFKRTKCCAVIITRKMKRTNSSVLSAGNRLLVIVNNSPSSRRISTFHFFFYDSHFGNPWKDSSFSLDDFEWQRGTRPALPVPVSRWRTHTSSDQSPRGM